MANEKTYKFDFEDRTHSNLYQDLISQMLDQYGIMTYYIPIEEYTPEELNTVFDEIKYRNYDRIYGFKALPDDMMIISGTDIFSKFGYQVQDEMTLWITRSEFIERITGVTKPDPLAILKDEASPYDDSYKSKTAMPKIGSLIWTPMWNSMWEISYCEHQENLVLGFRTVYRVNLKKYTMDKSDNININQQTNDDQELIDVINNIHGIEDLKNNEPIIEETQTGFGPDYTDDKKNDDIEELKKDIKDTEDDGDVFGKY